MRAIGQLRLIRVLFGVLYTLQHSQWTLKTRPDKIFDMLIRRDDGIGVGV